ncbi:TetR/AcrR family transcriptional regulator [Pseudomonas sp. L-22-4S-12]|uniref:TetR/AcrR family transcriptional regulator n=1 Tax=Pseudomonas sp. L-22-4S-12 TaxID=2610893 RepID=UPI001329F121|nr:TetR/AcrR family transcriptional regulator [Pseudomonas sp. L-22-4S-12]MWV14750.1 TetR/AcrR family transcriptional regulator [Pseudomonas sp. L-22-4S-12]
MPRSNPSADKILDSALHLADRCGWERLHLHEVAAELDSDLAAIARHYQQKDDLVEAWFDRADQALLARAKAADLPGLNAEKRLEELLVAWLASLATHRAVTGQMLLYKLEPGHVHLQLGGLLRISRTVQWWREAALRQNLHLSRIAEESLLTAVYLRTFVHWLRHPAEGEAELRALLRRQLRRGPLPWLLK